MADRACKSINTAGEPCKANPLKGSDYCSAHDPSLPDSVRFGSPVQAKEAAKLAGRPPLPKPTDVARALIEENVHRILRPHFRALGMDITAEGTVEVLERGAVLTGEAKDGTVVASVIEDLGAQIAAAEKLLDRVYGRPKQQTEISGPEGGPIELAPPADAMEKSRRAARLLSEHGLVDGSDG